MNLKNKMYSTESHLKLTDIFKIQFYLEYDAYMCQRGYTYIYSK